MKKLLLVLFCLPLFAAAQTSPPSIIPQPVSVKYRQGNFQLNSKTVLYASNPEDRKAASFLNDYLQQHYGFQVIVGKEVGTNFIRLSTKQFIKAPEKDAYTLTVDQKGINISGDTYAGTFYGIQTLIQLLPVSPVILNGKVGDKNKLAIPFIEVQDFPRFNYRGMHLDVSRHFFDISFVKKYIDYLALHKMNYFHWHLTDDQGWRIEIDKYPNLAAKAAWRNGTIIGRYPGTGNDNIRYGGIYTKEEIKEVVRYAMDRQITVIPEIEMPGHASAAIAAYPWLSCFPDEETVIPSHPSELSKQQKGKKVQETWGVFNDVFCAGSDSTFMFLQDVLDEVLPLFPSTYIHVGGDESPKANWKRCPRCQARIKALGLKDEHELQSYFIQRMEKYLNQKGRTLIGWDEILEGGLAPNAWVMSWRGEKGGIEAAKQKHKVIMTPGEYVYFDHTQTKNEDSVTIGGYTPLETVYRYEPVPKELDSISASYIAGPQANLWTEYIGSNSKVEYMVFPRMSALAEVQWSPKESRSWTDFENRLQTQFKRYDLWKTNYSRAYFDLRTQVRQSADGKRLNWFIQPKKTGSIVLITAPDFEQKYISADSISFLLTTSGTYKVQQVAKKPVKKNERITPIGTAVSIDLYLNKLTGKSITITKKPNEKYPGQPGAFSLVNGIYSKKGLSYPDWIGWIGDDLEATIDLGKKDTLSWVRMHTINQNGSWIYLPKYVEVQVSDDGKNFTSVGQSDVFVTDTLTMGWITVSFPEQQHRYLRVIAKNYGLIPDNLPGGGTRAWLFADELQAGRDVEALRR